MELLKKALVRESLQQLLSLSFLLLVSIALLIFSFEKSIIFPILGLIGMVVSIQLLYQTYRLLQPDEHKLVQLLREKPESIVWVYSVKTERLPFGFQFSTSTTLYFKLADGGELTVGISGKHLNVISRFLNRLLPHATFGYSSDRAQWYGISPDMLRKETEK